MPLKLQNAYGYAGATDALHNLIARQKAAEIAEAMAAYKAEQDAIKNSFEHRRVGVSEGNLGLDREKFGQDALEYTEGAEGRAADVRYKGAQTDELVRRPVEAEKERTHDITLEGVKHTNDLGMNTAREGSEGRLIGMRAGYESQHIGQRGAQQRLTDAAQAKQAGPGGAEMTPDELDKWTERLINNPDEFKALDQKSRTMLSRHMAMSANTPDSPLRKKAEAMRAEALDAIQKLRTMGGKSGAVGWPSVDPRSWPRALGYDAPVGSPQ